MIKKLLMVVLLVGLLAGMLVDTIAVSAQNLQIVDITAITFAPESGYITVGIFNHGAEGRWFSPRVYIANYYGWSGWTTLHPAKFLNPNTSDTWTSWFSAQWEATVLRAYLNIDEFYADPQTECATVAGYSQVGNNPVRPIAQYTECTYFDMDRFWSEPSVGNWEDTWYYGSNYDTISAQECINCVSYIVRSNDGPICPNGPVCTNVPMIHYYRSNLQATRQLYPPFRADMVSINDHYQWAPADGMEQRQHDTAGYPMLNCGLGGYGCIRVGLDEISGLETRHPSCNDETRRININYLGLNVIARGMVMSIETMHANMPLEDGPEQYRGGGGYCTQSLEDPCSDDFWQWKFGGMYLGYVMYDVDGVNGETAHYIAKTYMLDYYESHSGDDNHITEQWYLAEGLGLVRVVSQRLDTSGNVNGDDLDMTAYYFANGTW